MQKSLNILCIKHSSKNYVLCSSEIEIDFWLKYVQEGFHYK